MGKKRIAESAWDRSDRWYARLVGDEGHYYHQAIVLPRSLSLLNLQAGEALLDLGCGSGVLARSVPKKVEYVGVDAAQGLLNEARKRRSPGQFLLADATREFSLAKRDFDAATFLLSLQNMEDGQGAVRQAGGRLKRGGRLLIVLNHPCFRIPRQSGWGIDEESDLQYRRIQRYMTPLEIPIQMHPGKGERSETTLSFHRPLSVYSSWLWQAGFLIEKIEEWCSDKTSEGAASRRENRARREIPLFLALLARFWKGE